MGIRLFNGMRRRAGRSGLESFWGKFVVKLDYRIRENVGMLGGILVGFCVFEI